MQTACAQRFQNWFEHSGLPFFPDYTDHTFVHAIDVLKTAIDMTAEEAYPVLTGTDLAFLVMACCCHDAGMHITEEQFAQICTLDFSQYQSALDDKSWPRLWAEYLSESSRFSDRQLEAIFGDKKPPRPLPEDVNDYSKRDRLFVGEFLRRHHPRLAQEIANGLDEALGMTRTLADLDKAESDLVGLLARSHGMALRDAATYLSQHFDLRDFQGCHAVYLMGLIRIADYAQIQSARAPLIHGQLHKIRSPVSAREWRVHQSIANINNTHDDPEALFIDARPQSVGDLVKVKGWLNGLQNELDVAWAVLGEAYGRHRQPPLELLRLRVRRVRSNVTDGTGTKLPFVPEAFSFKVAEAEVLGLLLAPLYGSNPLYGLRELVQNARDAAIEATVASESRSQRPRVEIAISTLANPPTIRITDNGVGMSLDVIRSYFLNAGASFRRSDEWRSTFESEDGKAKIARSGRFGVGALAAFLVGDEMTVTTRHLGAPDSLGYRFTCHFQDREIEVRRTSSDIGTSIEIVSTQEKLKAIYDDLDIIRILFQFDDIELALTVDSIDGKPMETTLSRQSKGENDRLLSFTTRDLERVDLVITNEIARYYYFLEKVYVNGIAIAEIRDDGLSFREGLFDARELNYAIAVPSGYRREGIIPRALWTFYVEDRNGNVAINLARTAVTRSDEDVVDFLTEHFLKEIKQGYGVAIEHWGDRIPEPPVTHNEFILSADQILFFRGMAYVGDNYFPTAVGVRNFCRVYTSVPSARALSESNPGVIFQIGEIPQTKGELLRYFRDQDTTVAKDGSAIISLPKEFLEKTLSGANVPKWLREKIASASPSNRKGQNFLTFTFGDLGEFERETFGLLIADSRIGAVELYRSRDTDFEWYRWSRSRPNPRRSPFGRIMQKDGIISFELP